MANEAVGFRSALLGFDKRDVLACIDRLTAESQQAGKQAKEAAQTLQDQLNTAFSENTALKSKAQENNAVISQLVNQANEQQEKLQAANDKAAQLEGKASSLDNQNQEFRRRLFQGEEEAVRLRRENEQLRQDCAEKQEQLAQQTAHLAELKTTCETRLEQINAENDARIAQATREADDRIRTAELAAGGRVAQAEQQLAESRKALELAQAAPDTAEIRDSVQKMNRSLAEVKQDLSLVGENVNRLSADLQHSMEMLEAALSQAERDAAVVHTAACRKPLEAEPAFAGGTQTAPRTGNAAQSGHTGAAGRAPCGERAKDSGVPPVFDAKLPDFVAAAPTVAERLLDKLAKLLEQ